MKNNERRSSIPQRKPNQRREIVFDIIKDVTELGLTKEQFRAYEDLFDPKLNEENDNNNHHLFDADKAAAATRDDMEDMDEDVKGELMKLSKQLKESESGRKEVITVRLSSREKQFVEDIADNLGLSKSDVIRLFLRKAIMKETV